MATISERSRQQFVKLLLNLQIHRIPRLVLDQLISSDYRRPFYLPWTIPKDSEIIISIIKHKQAIGLSNEEIRNSIYINSRFIFCQNDLIDILSDYPIIIQKPNDDTHMTFNKKNAILLGNLPFNYPGQSKTKIWPALLEKIAGEQYFKTILIHPDSDLMRPHDSSGINTRKNWKNLGVNKIIINDPRLFEGAFVNTVTIIGGPVTNNQNIDLINQVTGKNTTDVDINGYLFKQIIGHSSKLIDILVRLKSNKKTQYKTNSNRIRKCINDIFIHDNKWCLVWPYQNFGYQTDPYNKLKIMQSTKISVDSYGVLVSFDSEEEATISKEYYDSYFQSEFITWVAKVTMYSVTLDDTQHSWVPQWPLPFDHILSDAEIYAQFKITKQEQNLVKENLQELNSDS